MESKIEDLAAVKSSAAGIGFSVLLAENKLYGTGLNTSGQLGVQVGSDGKNVSQLNSFSQIRTPVKEKTRYVFVDDS